MPVNAQVRRRAARAARLLSIVSSLMAVEAKTAAVRINRFRVPSWVAELAATAAREARGRAARKFAVRSYRRLTRSDFPPLSSTVNTSAQLAGEAARVVGLVLQRFELGLAEGVVVGHVRAAEASLNSTRRQQLRQRIALHRGAAIRVDGQAGLDAVAGDGLGEELRRQMLALPRCH